MYQKVGTIKCMFQDKNYKEKKNEPSLIHYFSAGHENCYYLETFTPFSDGLSYFLIMMPCNLSVNEGISFNFKAT